MKLFPFDWDNSGDNVRDSAMSNEAIAHEFMHGVSNRMTGNGKLPGCLARTTSKGMGEGWSDFMAVFVGALPEDGYDKQVALCTYLSHSENGIRERPYATDMNINGLILSNMKEEVC